MAKIAFDKIKAGLEEAKAYLDGSAKKCDYGIYVPVQKK
jgi:putative transcriptional regulator